ncbi:hypothetical protein A5761_09710 [Mycolicibacterium setense]|nr:hypothetical protein A5761_09710 [Mycolicibacterium setense]
MSERALSDVPTISELIDVRADLTPGATMLRDDTGDTVSFVEYRDRVRRRARELADLGVGRGATVCWQMPNTVNAMVWFGALSLLGARQAPMPIAYRRREIGGLLRLSEPDLVITAGQWEGRDYDAVVSGAVQDLGRAIPTISGAAPSPDVAWSEHDYGTRADVRYLYATSGSTGAPKLALHSDASVLAWARAQSSAQAIGSQDVVAYSVSLAHIGGAYMIGQALTCGNTALLLNGFDPVGTTETMDRHGTTVMMGVPTVYSAIVEERRRNPVNASFARLRFCASGAAPKPPALHAEVQSVIGGRGLVTSYGMTEAGAIAVASPDSTDEQLENTVGRPAAGISLRIVGSDGLNLEPGEVGEIRVHGPGVFAGYSDPALDADVFDEDGYFRTGDLGVLRLDGHLSIVGRLKDVIIRKGENVIPQEVEDALHRIAGVREAVVVGVPDPLVGERVCAIVTVTPGRILTLQEVASACLAEGLMIQKVPETLRVIDEIPRTPTGKADKVRLRADLAAS